MPLHRALVVSLALAGCSASHESPTMPWPPGSISFDAPVLAPRAIEPTGLDACLGAGGELVEIGSVDDNDVHDHGALLTFGISPGGLVAAAGADGTLKFWTLESELLAVADGSALTYGSETGAVPITDLAFDAEAAIAGDVRGLVQAFGADGRLEVRGGTTPDVPIVAVAFDAPTRRLAHAQRGATIGEVVPLVVRGPDGPIEIADTLDDPRDLAFTDAGDLAVAGAHGGGAAIEVRDAADPSVVHALVRPGSPDPILEISAAREGDVVAAVSAAGLVVLRDDEIAREVPVPGAASVAITPSGAYALTIGDDGALRAHATDDGREVASVSVPAGIVVRVDATGQRVIVGGSDAILHVLACSPSE